jgi:S-adenosylmethionine hydrolase
MAPTITLTTDFGLADAYVGVMKGVILSRCPAARLVDLTHGIAPGRIASAAYVLSTAWRYFPDQSVHLAVVDPGVGTSRRIIAAQIGTHRFVAPDNGLLSLVLDEAGDEDRRVVHVTREDLNVVPTSRTFHGRDIFAPIAAALACGVPLHELGNPVAGWIRLPSSEPIERDGGVNGEVIHIDRFGNLITNIGSELVSEGDAIEVAGRRIEGLAGSYGSVEPGELLALIGSTGRLEISVNGGDAAAELAADLGTRVEVVKS